MSVTTLLRPVPRGLRLMGQGARPHYALVCLTALVNVWLVIMMGSVVRISGNGLGCPDWPLCYGQAIPPWTLSPWIEFSHRLLGATTGLHIVALAVLAWRDFRRERRIVLSAMAAAAMLIVQVALGGLHVILELPPSTGWIHTAVAMALAGSVAWLAAATHPAARRMAAQAAAAVTRDRGLPSGIAAAALAMYLLTLTGAYVTRTGASLACPAFPYCGVETYVPALAGLIAIQMLHRFTAFAAAIIVSFMLLRLVRAARHDASRAFRGAALALTAILVVQFGLGIANVLLRLPMWSRPLHLMVAAVLWTGLVMLWTVFSAGADRDAPAIRA